ncbi:uncharacterized protein LOC123515704 isoform X3 [Portunus trituberculatus]|uniref:uncharacterized protein LOC123515704 isoform X3 n=1 Tax=Portunus trituberculatus TaxID=210409 RepID=UPI001E1CE2A3|nr:uncharacterized protein LOC123515704 isoform X3 [Portunus trituberculatus]
MARRPVAGRRESHTPPLPSHNGDSHRAAANTAKTSLKNTVAWRWLLRELWRPPARRSWCAAALPATYLCRLSLPGTGPCCL